MQLTKSSTLRPCEISMSKDNFHGFGSADEMRKASFQAHFYTKLSRSTVSVVLTLASIDSRCATVEGLALLCKLSAAGIKHAIRKAKREEMVTVFYCSNFGGNQKITRTPRGRGTKANITLTPKAIQILEGIGLIK